jgi:phage terminase large subunit
MDQTITRAEAITRLWMLGVLTWKLDPLQLELYKFFLDNKKKTTVWSCSRRLGKSYALCCIAIEKCLKKPNTTIKFIAPTQKHVKMIIRPLLKEILKDCPKEIRPDFRTADNMYRFQNGSEIQLAGTDSGHAENLRGGSADLCIIDEAGFCDDLSYIVQSILVPTTTTTHGKIILSSTPPKTIDHEFAKYMENAEENGTFIKRTVYDGIGYRLTHEMVQEIIDELGGVDSPEFRREYLCELIMDEDSSVVPEFSEFLQSQIVKEHPQPPHFDAYVAGDLGAKDFTVFLFAYYDFRNAKIVVEDEVVLKGGSRRTTTDLMAVEIKQKEKLLWTNPETGDQKKPYKRVCDNDLLVINNLYAQNNLLFTPTDKYDSHAALNNMRMLLKNFQIIIHPRCKTLIQHLKYATWATNKKTYARDTNNGHYDAVDALKYLVRNVQMTKNPYPTNYGLGSGDNWWGGFMKPTNPTSLPDKAVDTIKNLFKPKPSLKFGSRNNK